MYTALFMDMDIMTAYSILVNWLKKERRTSVRKLACHNLLWRFITVCV